MQLLILFFKSCIYNLNSRFNSDYEGIYFIIRYLAIINAPFPVILFYNSFTAFRVCMFRHVFRIEATMQI